MRTAVRIALRDAWKRKGTSLIVLVMIALPVMGATGFAVFYKTKQITGTEAIERYLGTADALVTTYPGEDPLTQRPDPRDGFQIGEHPLTIDPVTGQPPALEQPDVLSLIGDRRAILMREDPWGWFQAGQSLGRFEITEVDANDRLSAGLFHLIDGRYPRVTGEIAVSRAMADRGAGIGRDIKIQAGTDSDPRMLHVVGVADRADRHGGLNAVVPPGVFGPGFGAYLQKWLVGGGPMPWSQVQQLNKHGVTVLSRDVQAHPPNTTEILDLPRYANDGSFYAVFGTVVAMVLIETVLLAGPAMAVGARRQRRTLALISAAGGTPTQVRSVVLASGLVFGALGSLVGVTLGLGLEALLQPVAQHYLSTALGPWDAPWVWIAIIAALGTASAVAAAVIPARTLARQDAAAAIAGRRERLTMPARLPIAGVVIIAVGVAVTYSRLDRRDNNLTIAIGAVLCVIGMALVVPFLVALVGRLAHKMALPFRFAARDGARHRMRTVPAISAVAATVAGFVAASIGMATHQAQDRRDYESMQTLETGVGVVRMFNGTEDAARKVIAEHIPGAQFDEIHAGNLKRPDGSPGGLYQVAVDRVPQASMALQPISDTVSLVIEDAVPVAFAGLSVAERAQANAVLSGGGGVVFTTDAVRQVSLGRHLELNFWVGNNISTQVEADTPIVVIHAERAFFAAAILSPRLADKMGIASSDAYSVVRAPVEISKTVEEDISLRLGDPGSFDVERGYEGDIFTSAITGLLLILATLLMFAGALTATFLALADARPDLSTLSAVGASPSVRRAISAATALGIAGVGAVLGLFVGLAPGIAVTYPLTRTPSVPSMLEPSHVLAIPWGELSIVVIVLPIVTAAIAALLTRSKVPSVARWE